MLPFHTNKLFGLSLKQTGFAIPTEDGIKLAFADSSEADKAFLEKKSTTVLIRWQNLKNLKIKKGFLADQVFIEINEPSEVPELTEAQDGKIELDTEKSNRPLLDEFDLQVKKIRAGQNADVEGMLDDIRGFLYDN